MFMQSSEILFQYITCYSLSKKKLSKCETTSCFNTSHVTLYLDVPPEWLGEQFLFQYITCYSLSVGKKHADAVLNSFNTSHVTLYQTLAKMGIRVYLVSIHHMLLFIKTWLELESLSRSFNTSHVTLYHNRGIEHTKADAFQYITCYSLSLVL